VLEDERGIRDKLGGRVHSHRTTARDPAAPSTRTKVWGLARATRRESRSNPIPVEEDDWREIELRETKPRQPFPEKGGT